MTGRPAVAAPGAAVPSHWDPPADPAVVGRVLTAIEAAGVPVRRRVPLGPFTTFGIGGPAAALVEPGDAAGLGLVLRTLDGTAEEQVPLLVVGRGSNLLVSDAGFPGLVVRLGRGFRGRRRDGDLVEAGAAVAMPALAAWVAEEGLAGLEFAAGIPGSVGGAVRMNAGAHGGAVDSCLLEADLMYAGDGTLRPVEAAALGLGYRRSSLPARSVVVAARWRLSPDDPASVRARLDELRAWRRRSQPLRDRNCGSVFANPAGDSAGRLVEAAGLKGHRHGSARVSEKHANFIVVERGASADDVLALIARMRADVLALGGPELHPEVRVVGRFNLGSSGPATEPLR